VHLGGDRHAEQAACDEPMVAVVQKQLAVEADEQDRRDVGRPVREAAHARADVPGQDDLLLTGSDVHSARRSDRDQHRRDAQRNDLRTRLEGDPERLEDLLEGDRPPIGRDAAKRCQGTAALEPPSLGQVSGGRAARSNI
jgi:hypothetical protein